jgi:uracil phosphoribosyltransferase
MWRKWSAGISLVACHAAVAAVMSLGPESQSMRAHENADVVTHPLAQHHLTTLRRVETGHDEFRTALVRLGRVCGTELVADKLPTETIGVQTPLAETTGYRVREGVVVVTVLRAAIPFVEGLLDTIPGAQQGVISASRDEEAGMTPDGEFPVAVDYVNVPAIDEDDTLVVADPMLATGSTMVTVLDELLSDADPDAVVVLSVVSAPPGLARVADEHPEVDLVTVSVDDRLDENGFIIPGLGDAGDRAFGTD